MQAKQVEPVDSGSSVRKVPTWRIIAPMILVAVVVAVAAIVGILPRSQQRESWAAEAKELSVPTVTVISPKNGVVADRLNHPAEIKPVNEAVIYARANGYVKRLLVDLGDRVKAGQLLAEIDTPELDHELERAKALLEQAQAAVGLAKITSERWTDLSKTASVSDQETAEKQADFKLKTATTDSARAEVRRLEKLKGFAKVTAPFNGIVTVRKANLGDLIVAGGTRELFQISQTEKLRVFVNVPQSTARSITIGQSADLSLSELPGRTFKAKVVRTAGAISPDSRTLLVELEVDNQKNEILAGGFAQVSFPEAKLASALTIPANAIMFRADGTKVGVVLSDDKVELRKVKLGKDFGQTMQILEGLSGQDRVIVNPPESLAAGTIVVATESSKTTKAQ
jgi:RND family efflux transporter MFP subunit